VHAPNKDESDDMKGSFYEELEYVPTFRNESLHEISKYNGVRIVNIATARNPIVKSTMSPHRNNTLGLLKGKTYNQIDHILTDNWQHSSVIMSDILKEMTVKLNIIWWL
jgi:hypothetical protein